MSYYSTVNINWVNKPDWATGVAVNTVLDTPTLFWVSHLFYSEFISSDGRTTKNANKYSSERLNHYNKEKFRALETTEKTKVKIVETPKYSSYHRLAQSQYPPVYDDEGNFLGVMLDAYDVFEAFDPKERTDAETHALKKLLVPGKRGAKGVIQDIKEAIWSLNLALVKRIHREAKNKYLNK